MHQKPNFKKISIHTGPKQSSGFLLWQLSTEWRSSIEATLKIFELTHPQFVLLAAIAWCSKSKAVVTQVMIGKMARLDSNTTSQILRGLEKKELVKRSSSSDGRVKHVALTSSGSEKVRLALPAVEQADGKFFSSLSLAESSTLVDIFQKLCSDARTCC